MQGWGGVCHSGVNEESNRCYSYLSQMQNDANRCSGGVGGSCRSEVGDTGVEWVVKNFTKFDLSQVRCSVFFSEKLLSTAFWIMWEKACFCW